MTTLKDIIMPACDEVTKGFSDVAYGIRGFGSAFLRDIKKTANNYMRVQDSLDKKPDLIVVVNENDISECINRVCDKLDTQTVDKFRTIAQQNAEHAPIYAHVKTENRHEVKIGDIFFTQRIPYRITLATPEHLTLSGSKAYTMLRMSKPTTEIYRGPNHSVLDLRLEQAYKHITEQTLHLLPKQFTVEQFLKKYCQYTYLMECYRVNDILGKKANKIYEGKIVTDIISGTVEEVKDVLAQLTRPHLTNYVKQYIENGVLQQSLTRNRTIQGSVYKDLLFGNINAAKVSLRNAKLHKAQGHSRAAYIKRKAKVLLPTPSN